MSWLKQVADGIEISVKVVPGASRDRVAGVLGDALKVQVSAPPERGKANAAVVSLLAALFGVGERDIRVIRGLTSPRKVLMVRGVSVATAETAVQR